MEKRQLAVDIKVPNQTRYLSLIGRIGEDVVKELEKYKGDRDTLAYHVNLVLTEAMVNAIKHANANDPDKMVHVVINITDDELLIKVYDSGQGFDFNAVPQPAFDELSEQGRGIFLIRSLMDSVTYKKLGNGNVLQMCKRIAS